MTLAGQWMYLNLVWPVTLRSSYPLWKVGRRKSENIYFPRHEPFHQSNRTPSLHVWSEAGLNSKAELWNVVLNSAEATTWSLSNISITMQVMGAKKGGTTTRQLTRKLQGMKVLNEIQQVLKIPIKYIHVIRNPYDNISTMLLRALDKRTAASNGAKVITVCCSYYGYS